VTAASVSTICAANGSFIGASSATAPAIASGTPVHSNSRRGSCAISPRFQPAYASITPASTAMPTSNPTVPGGLPSCRPASVSVP
jgi:hypothetical protein